jgi:hypothetical protein
MFDPKHESRLLKAHHRLHQNTTLPAETEAYCHVYGAVHLFQRLQRESPGNGNDTGSFGLPKADARQLRPDTGT